MHEEQFPKNMKLANKSSYKLCKSLFFIIFFCRYEILHGILDGFENARIKRIKYWLSSYMIEDFLFSLLNDRKKCPFPSERANSLPTGTIRRGRDKQLYKVVKSKGIHFWIKLKVN